MSENAVFLDTNVFMYAAGAEHPCKASCVAILADVEAGKLQAAINVEVLQEILYRFSFLHLAEKGLQLCRMILDLPLTLLPVTEADVRQALGFYEGLRDKGFQPRDAIHAATMKNHGLTRLISADRAFDSMEFLVRTDSRSYSGPS